MIMCLHRGLQGSGQDVWHNLLRCIPSVPSGAALVLHPWPVTPINTMQVSTRLRDVQDNADSETVLPRVPFSACLAKWAGEEVMADYFSAAVGHKTQAKRFSRIANFPPYLMLQMNRQTSDGSFS